MEVFYNGEKSECLMHSREGFEDLVDIFYE